MTNIVDFEQSLSKGRRAFQYMVDKRSAPIPRNYELWYSYISSHSKELVEAVNAAIGASGALSESDAEKIFAEFLRPEPKVDAVDDIGLKISDEVEHIVTLLDNAAGNSSKYSESLDEVSAQLGGNVDGVTLAKLVEVLVSSTKDMSKNNRALEESLSESKQQIAELNLLLDAVRSESRTDQLTGIPNRKHFDEYIDAKISEANQTGDELSLLVGDIDFFKKFNDTWGHQTGDQVLRLVANALKSSVKGRDFAARYGGEEFAVILPATNLQSAVAVGNNIRETVKGKELVKKSTGENLGTITMSFGAARYRLGESAEEFINRADQCLYAAKKGGRNMVKCETDPDVEFDVAVA